VTAGSERGSAQAPGEAAGLERGNDLTPAELLALIEAERARASAALVPDPRVLYAVWGIAWLVGFAVLYVARTGTGPVGVAPAVAGAAFGVLLVAAMVVTGVHFAARVAGVRGPSSRIGAMYGWAWTIGFLAYAAIMVGAARAGVDDAVMGLLWTAGSGLVVGLLYLSGGALWQDRVQYGLGAWILVTSAVGALAGTPAVYLVMSLGGGGGFLLAAAYLALRPTGAERVMR